MSKKKSYYNDKVEVEATFDGYFPPSQEDVEILLSLKISSKLVGR